MTIYLMPIVGTGTLADGFRAKYFEEVNPSARTCFQVGREPFCIFAVTDIDPAMDATIQADSECTKIPPLGNTVGAGALATVQSKIEGIGIPAGWVTAGMTYQTVLTTCLRITQLYRRLAGTGAGRLLASGVTLNTQFQDLPAGVRQKMLTMAQSLNFDTSSLTGASTIRQILKALADQWTENILFRGLTF